MLPKKSRRPNREKPLGQAIRDWFFSDDFKCVLALTVGTALLVVMFSFAITPQRYDLKVGSISNQTITATKDVEDVVSTAARREAAARAVEPTYHLKEGVTEEVMLELDGTFKELQAVQQYGQSILTQQTAGVEGFKTDEIDFAKAMLTKIALTDYQITSVLSATDEAFSEMVQAVSTAVRNTLNTTIREGQVNESIQTILQIAGFRVETNLLQNVVTPVLRKCISPNMVIEQETTEIAQQNARDEVEPIIYIQGQNIIRAGERVALNQMEMLRSLGLLDDNSVDILMYSGALLMVLIAIGTMLIVLGMMRHAILRDVRKMWLLMLVINASVGCCIITMKAANAYIAPVAMSAMLLTGLLGGTVGLSGGLCVTIIVSALSAGSASNYAIEMVHLMLMGFTGSIVAARFLRKRPQRVRVLLCGIVVALANFIVVLSIGLMNNNELNTVWQNGAWTLASGIIASVITLALQPLFETAFSISTQSKLLELTNPNHPLLRRMLLEAAGTYHHCLIVANLAEAAAEAIGANPLLTRAGSYFHDVGKLKRPLYFKENQQGDNLHDHTDPYVSAAIVTAHPGDGLQLAQKFRLPLEVQRIITEHHGDTPVMYFYHKALQQSDGKPVDIADFRYDGKRPSTKESAIVMLADTVEAAVRAMPDPTPKAIEAFVERLIRGKLEDGQLSDSPLTLRDIDKICEAFVNALNGAFHERIEYPTVNVPKRVANVVNTTPPAAAEHKEPESEPAAQPAEEPTEQAAPESVPESESETEKQQIQEAEDEA